MEDYDFIKNKSNLRVSSDADVRVWLPCLEGVVTPNLGVGSLAAGQWVAGKATFTWTKELPPTPPSNPSPCPFSSSSLLTHLDLLGGLPRCQNSNVTHRRSSGCWSQAPPCLVASLDRRCPRVQPSPNYWFPTNLPSAHYWPLALPKV